MPKTRSLATLAAVAVLLGSGFAAQAYATPTTVVAPSHPFTTAERTQLAMEAGISPKQAQSLTLGQLAWLKAQRDGDNGAYSGPPVHVDPSQIHS